MATQNTTLSDINEIFVGYILAGNKWFDEAAKKHYYSRVAIAKPEEVIDAQGKSVAMAAEFLSWAKRNGYSSKVKNVSVWWTARAGSMSKAVGVQVDQRKNPTDILVCFTSGPANGFLGLSAKATKTKGDIGFKNPGIGTVDRNLKLQLADAYKKVLDKAISDFDLPNSATVRKSFIRANPKIKTETEAIGSNILQTLRDLLLVRLNKMSQVELMKYLISDWMDADVLYPPYIKVTGQGNKAPYRAMVSDPINNPKLAALSKYPIKLTPLGNVAIGVKAGDKQIMKIRFKFESEKLASPIKLSGDPW